ncbi:MAG: hypothetical protein K9N38_07665 [Candidatus Marinimicrobia bacterium]|nr:hypothetical protein [Candidatus Neomarinimicrobiota bacterium]MCF7851049.1 hypothetical protein [Candidatus Neomarinimicrobiota bacterium]
MEGMKDVALANPMIILGAVFLVILIIVFIIKKVFKIAMFAVGLLIAYAAYLFFTQDDPMATMKKQVETGKAAMEKVDKATENVRDGAVEKIVDEVEEKLKEAAKDKE